MYIEILKKGPEIVENLPAKGRYDGRRACVVTDAGGPGVMTTSDELNRQGIKTPLLKPDPRRVLSDLLTPGAAVTNPVDFLPTRTPEQVARTLEIIARQEGDAIWV